MSMMPSRRSLGIPLFMLTSGWPGSWGGGPRSLTGIVEAYHRWEGISDDLSAAREMAAEDPEFAAEVPELEAALEVAAAKLTRLLIPRDPDDVTQRDP